jgi:hypothetical protein
MHLTHSTALLPVDARQSDRNVAWQGLLDHLGIDGSHVLRNSAQQFSVRDTRMPLAKADLASDRRLPTICLAQLEAAIRLRKRRLGSR